PGKVYAGAALMTALDLFVDPVSSRVLLYWHWRQPGFWFGVPLINFVGWFVVSLALLSAAGPPRNSSLVVKAVGISVLVFLAASAAHWAFNGLETSDSVVGQVWARKGGAFLLQDKSEARWTVLRR